MFRFQETEYTSWTELEILGVTLNWEQTLRILIWLIFIQLNLHL
jgi:hypothetical protein